MQPRRKRAQTTRLASFGPPVSIFFFFSLFFIPINVLLYRLVIIYVINDRESVLDGDDDVWASVSVFFFSFVFFILINVLLYILLVIYVINDMESVGRWWRRERTLGEYSCLFLRFVFSCIRTSLYANSTQPLRDGVGDRASGRFFIFIFLHTI